MGQAMAVHGRVNLLGEPQNAVYDLSKAGTLALLKAVSAADPNAAAAMAKPDPREALIAYLDTAFLGPFLRSGKEIPFAETAGEIGTYIEYLDHELARGALHTTLKHQTHLKLLAYLTAVEAPVPLLVFRNALRFLATRTGTFALAINKDAASAPAKLKKIKDELDRVTTPPAEFVALHSRLDALFDSLRHAVAHSTYRVDADQKRVVLWNSIDSPPETRTFEQVAQAYEDARCYLIGFFAGVGEFAYELRPDCPFVWAPSR